MAPMQDTPQAAGRINQRPTMRNSDSTVEIDLVDVLRVLIKHLPLILAAVILGGAVAFAVTALLIKPTYRSGFTAFVNNRNGQEDAQSIQSGDVAAGQSLTRTYAAIMESRPVVEDALEKSGLAGQTGYDYESVSGAISTDVESDAQLVNLYVTLTEAEAAYKLADALSKVAPDYISDIVEGTSMKIVSNAVLPRNQYSPHPAKNTVIGALIGALLVMVIVVIRDLTDTRIKSEQDLVDRFGIPVIGTIPNYEQASSSRKKYGKYGKYGNYGSYGG